MTIPDARVTRYVTRQRRGEDPEVGLTVFAQDSTYRDSITHHLTRAQARALALDLLEAAGDPPDTIDPAGDRDAFILKTILENPTRADAVDAITAELGVSIPTAYRYIRTIEPTITERPVPEWVRIPQEA